MELRWMLKVADVIRGRQSCVLREQWDEKMYGI